MFWHIHHDVLLEYSHDIRERIAYIKREKPKEEIPLRLKLMQPVRSKLPDEVVKACAAYVKACAAIDKACAALGKANAALDKAIKKHMKEIKALHKVEFPTCSHCEAVILWLRKMHIEKKMQHEAEILSHTTVLPSFIPQTPGVNLP
jgi:hypothetical protein